MRSASDPTELHSRQGRQSAVRDLDRCISLVSLLGDRVDRATSFVRNMPGTCKGCHGPTGSDHVGSRWGFEHCILPHSTECPGGVKEDPGKKRPCPEDFQPPRSVQSGNETEVSEQRNSDLSDDDDDDSESDSGTEKVSSVSKEFKATSKSGSLQDVMFSATPPILSNSLLSGMAQTSLGFGVGSSSLLTALQGAAALSSPLMSSGVGAAGAMNHSNLQVAGAGGFQQPQPDLSQNFLLQQVLAQQLQQQQHQAAMLQENQRVIQEMRAAVVEAKEAARSAASVRPKNSVSFSDNLVSETESLRDKNKKKKKTDSSTKSITMPDIRKISGLRDSVEEVMDNEVYKHASLARSPSANYQASRPSGHTPQAESPSAKVILELRAQLAAQQKSLDSLLGPTPVSKSERRAARKAETELAASKDKAERKVAKDRLAAAREVASQAKEAAHKLGVLGLSSTSDTGTESDDELEQTLTKKKKSKMKICTPTHLEDSSDEAEALPKLVTDVNGRTFRVVGGRLEAMTTYVKDPSSGKLIRTTPNIRDTTSASSESSDDQVVRKKEKKARQKARRALEKEGSATGLKENKASLNGITPLVARKQQLPPVPYLQDNKGKSQVSKDQTSSLSVVDWAKMCPIKYAPTCNAKNLNLPVFLWARLAEIRALSAGVMDTRLQPGEMDARLRHLQCVLELVGTNSILSEYSGYGWQLGRDYDKKVQATMDSGASDWVSFNSMFSLGPHPSFVLSAKDEVEKVSKKIVNTREEDPNKVRKKIFGRFNSCRTVKRCDWKLENPNSGRCKRLHQCSYCKTAQNRSVFHQAWDCPAGGKEAVAAGTHSL